MASGGARWLAVGLALGACNLEVDYVGARCDIFGHGCPAPLVCDLGRLVCVVKSHPCQTGNGGCDAHATCTELSHGASCACQDGYVGDGLQCSPDEPATLLASLTVDLDGAPVSLGFEAGVRWYGVPAPPGARQVRVAAMPRSATASLTANGTPLAAGAPFTAPLVNLQAKVAVKVTAGAAERTYTVDVAPAP